MRIACVLELSGSGVEGGRDIATMQLVRSLRRKGAEVDVYSYRRGIPHILPRAFRETPLLRAVTAFPLSGRAILASLDGRYDILYITSTSTATFFSPETPTLLYCHGVIANKWDKAEIPPYHRLAFNAFSRAVMAWFERRCMENVDAVIGVSEASVAFIREGLKVKGTALFTLGNGVDTDLFKPGGGEGRGVVFVGRASRNKGFDALLQACPAIEARVTAVVSRIGRRMMDASRKAGLDILLNVPYDRMPSVYGGSSVFVLPSRDEEHPLATLEAMACGLPVVVSPAGAAGMVEDGRGGYVVPAGDPGELARKVNSLLEDAATRREMGARNRRVVEGSCSWELVSDAFLAICSEVIGAKRRS